MRTACREPRGLWTPTLVALALLALLALPACLVIVSTGPTPVGGGTIVFVAVDDHGGVVAAVGITVVGVGGDWHQQGITAGDGAFSCTVQRGVTRVRAEVTPPAGYVLADPNAWPREVDVSTAAGERIEVRVQRARP